MGYKIGIVKATQAYYNGKLFSFQRGAPYQVVFHLYIFSDIYFVLRVLAMVLDMSFLLIFMLVYPEDHMIISLKLRLKKLVRKLVNNYFLTWI